MSFLIRLAVVGGFLLLLTAGASNGSGVAVGLVAIGILAAAGLIYLRYRIALARLAPTAPLEAGSAADAHGPPLREPVSRWRALLHKGRIGDSSYHGGNEYFNEGL